MMEDGELDPLSDQFLECEVDAAADLVFREVESDVCERVDEDGADTELECEVGEFAWRLGEVERQRTFPDEEAVAERLFVAFGCHAPERACGLAWPVGCDVEDRLRCRLDSQPEQF